MKPLKPDEIGKPAEGGKSLAPNDGEPPPKWAEHVARTTVALAVLAAVASGQNAGEFSATILAQGEENDAWAYYQAKSMKGTMELNQAEVLRLMADSDPKVADKALALAKTHDEWRERYEREAKLRYDEGKKAQGTKGIHMGRSNGLAHSFIALQAGVILCTLATSRRNRRFWLVALAFGIAGLLLAGNAYLRLVPHV
jgi:hypothetical protein